MRRTRTLRAGALLFSLALVATACGGRDEDTTSGGGGSDGGGGSEETSTVDLSNCPDTNTAGISDDNVITLASSFPQSGLTSAFAQISKGYKAYFDKVNSEGGVEIAGESYTIEVVDKDDEYNASKTAQNINELVGTEGDQAFAVFNVVGTANNVTIREDLNENCVPNLFAGTGSPTWGNPDYPWLVGSTLAPYTLETQAFASWLQENQPDAKIAMLVQDDDFGAAYEQGLRLAIEGTDIEVVEVAKYPTGSNDVAAQVTSLAASDADAFFNGATLLACPNALQEADSKGWDVTTFVSGTCISKTLMGLAGESADGVLATTNIKDPQNPAYDEDPAMVEYLETLAEFGEADVDPENGIVAYGYTQAALFVHVLEQVEELTRSNVLDALRTIDTADLGLLMEGVQAKMDWEDDPFLAENLQLIQYSAANGYFDNVGEIIDFEGKTAEFTPEELINN